MDYKFNINTSGLTAYVDENNLELNYQLQMDSTLMPYSEIHTGVKGTERLHFQTTTVTFQTDSCAFNASDTTTMTEKDITVGKIAIMETLCMKLLNGFWAQQILAAGSHGEDAIPAEISQAYMAEKLNKVKKAINVADWQGDTASGTANLNKYNGLIKEIFADGSVIDGNTSDAATATTASNILARMQEQYLAMPVDMFEEAPDGGNLVWFVSPEYWRFYTEALKAANLFNWVGGENSPEATRYYGTNIEIVPQVGLSSQDKMILTTRGNIQIATDLESDESEIKIWYSEDDRINKSLIAFKRGITYKFSDYIVKWGLGTS